ncbi:MAG TPA: hypothetical protein PK213_01280 [Deltaproteobacteria bacterium]|jgi:hypothetical protein|nr:hypothetical protein [Deltaproteobacteria bacterium]
MRTRPLGKNRFPPIPGISGAGVGKSAKAGWEPTGGMVNASAAGIDFFKSDSIQVKK